MGQTRNGSDIDNLQRGVRNTFKEYSAGFALDDCGFPLGQVIAIHKRDLNPVTGQNLLKNVETRPEQGAGRHHMIPRAQHGHQRPIHRRHSRGGCKSIFCALNRRDTILEHCDSRVAVAGIDKFLTTCFDKAGLGRLGAVIDKTLGHKDCLRHFAILAAAGA